jgi:hypothetical protein
MGSVANFRGTEVPLKASFICIPLLPWAYSINIYLMIALTQLNHGKISIT